MIKSYEDLEVYKESYQLALKIHNLAIKMPHEAHEIKKQSQKASLSIALNIAEGYAKKDSIKEFKRFLMISAGSSNEMQVLVEFMKDTGYISDKEHKDLKERYNVLAKRIQTMINTWK